MLEKQKGKINELVYEHTAHRGGKYRLYPTIEGLYSLLEELMEAKATATDYLRITPFYVNEKVNRQIEFDSFMFFVECRENYTEEEEEALIVESLEREERPDAMIDWEKGRALYSLCRFDDPGKFSWALKNHRNYLDTALPEMFAIAKEALKLSEEDVAFGFFCFEIHSD